MSNIAYVQKINMEENKVGLVLQKYTNAHGETYYRLPMLVNTEVEPAAPACERVFDDPYLGPVRVMAFRAVDAVPAELTELKNLEVVPGGDVKDLIQNCFTSALVAGEVQLSVTSGTMLHAMMAELRELSHTRNSGWFTHRD